MRTGKLLWRRDAEHGVERKRDVDETPVVWPPQICDPHNDHHPQNVEESLFAYFKSKHDE